MDTFSTFNLFKGFLQYFSLLNWNMKQNFRDKTSVDIESFL